MGIRVLILLRRFICNFLHLGILNTGGDARSRNLPVISADLQFGLIADILADNHPKRKTIPELWV
jgi:hypothetical protein